MKATHNWSSPILHAGGMQVNLGRVSPNRDLAQLGGILNRVASRTSTVGESLFYLPSLWYPQSNET